MKDTESYNCFLFYITLDIMLEILKIVLFDSLLRFGLFSNLKISTIPTFDTKTFKLRMYLKGFDVSLAKAATEFLR